MDFVTAQGNNFSTSGNNTMVQVLEKPPTPSFTSSVQWCTCPGISQVPGPVRKDQSPQSKLPIFWPIKSSSTLSLSIKASLGES
ncbi:hypothetical protein HAX54_023495 [Datura stramonium]|uniref:Uncharacterized protein n=1 Tax=Datura stramonium TaxID=4076 RepID=A0ABS8UY39_DATST|nr:hypothetical protein [Datura stramonium]